MMLKPNVETNMLLVTLLGGQHVKWVSQLHYLYICTFCSIQYITNKSETVHTSNTII